MGRAALLRLSLNCSSGRESAPISYEIPRIVSRLTSAATIKWGFETVSATRPYRLGKWYQLLPAQDGATDEIV
jgi:hypothetical protein